MKLVTFVHEKAAPQIGVLTENEQTVVVLQRAMELMDGAPCPHFQDMLAFLRGGHAARARAWDVLTFVANCAPAHATLRRSDVRLLAPVPRPESLRNASTFEDRVINSTRITGLKRLAPLDRWLEKTLGRPRTLAYRRNRVWYQQPLYSRGNRLTVVGPDSEIRIPKQAEQFDFGLELGVFVGKAGRDIPLDQAQEHIGGYTIYNNFSACDCQQSEIAGGLGTAKGKDFDTGNALGPYLVTPDEITDPKNLPMRARINGEVRSEGTSADMHWSFAQIITHMSQSETLYPGEFIGSGTCSGPAGSGCGQETGRFLKPDDRVALEVEGLGVLRNRVVRGTEPQPA